MYATEFVDLYIFDPAQKNLSVSISDAKQKIKIIPLGKLEPIKPINQ